MINRIEELIDFLKTQPNHEAGFSANQMTLIGRDFGLTCREVCDHLTGKARAISHGKYAASISEETRLLAEAAKANGGKLPKEKKIRVGGAPKAKRNVSSVVFEKQMARDSAEAQERKNLIAEIAKRHAREAAVIESLVVADNKNEVETDDGTHEEFEKLLTASTSNPLS